MILIDNRRVRHEYEIIKTYTAGMVLSGPEVKSLRAKKGSLTGSYAKIINGELFLLNAQINPYEFADNSDYDPKRTRKLLLKRKEIDQLLSQTEQKNLAIIPLNIRLEHNRIKTEIGLGRGLKKHQKREVLKRRAQERDAAREMKYRP